jgi:hypothetical protein
MRRSAQAVYLRTSSNAPHLEVDPSVKPITPTQLAVELWKPQNARLRRLGARKIRQIAEREYESPGIGVAWYFTTAQAEEIRTMLKRSGWAPDRHRRTRRSAPDRDPQSAR